MRCEKGSQPLAPEKGLTAGQQAVSFSQFVVKLHSRCNFACPDCYIYGLRDSGWAAQPRVMSTAVLDRTAQRIVEHVWRHRPSEARVLLHGGEPLLAGPRRIGHFAETLRSAWTGLDTSLELVVQTNGALLNRSYLDLFRRWGITVGVSLDGTGEGHDRRRRYHSGKGTHADVVRGLDLLRTPGYRSLYAGLLCTVDLADDPVDTYEALLAHEPPALDFLMPLGTWQSAPPGPPGEPDVPYARWLATAFDRWFDAPVREVPLRLFDSLVDRHLGGAGTSEVWGAVGSDVVVVQPDGSIEQNDILKSVHDNAAHTGYHIEAHGFDDAAVHPGFAADRAGAEGLSAQCRACPVVGVCGGGLRAHRYRPENGFDNPSCYCADLRALIEHVRERVTRSLHALAKDCHKAVTGGGILPNMGMPADVEPLHRVRE
ncbi:FxsB family cyclophane-forming radical SAM/SPASM peptide maturase [Streptomyces phaeochromogenes]|uniref:FxsB family cyclophane-forming radical SAM/SPASM peptide maturase n=1 Tax=Streptomyces phaeochromogenes TaxID=1923 RepID=UPI002DD89708|nr:FxsB family cyclophane-forming radical SAM/SPASM peptide maturase [Streptomyces phaeochromogenes]WRZ31035.1 FxsB family radical SAM/SPASM domain protein [Streptomyces phaeochromogenes]